MNGLKQLREALGISQKEMAGLLGLNRGQIAMAETGKRTLPDHAQMFVAWMQDELDAWPQVSEIILPPMDSIQNEIRILEIRLAHLKLELENRELKDQKAGFLQFICGKFPGHFPDGIPTLSRNTIAVLLSIEDLRKDTELSGAPVFLRSKIKGLEGGIAWLKAAI